jgi:6-pyruvoyltetrahydropterin/6-carboxytetrahydropterin synthase
LKVLNAIKALVSHKKSLMLTHEKIRVTRRFTFDMAHALYGHDGPCRNIHGHTYTLEVTVLGEPSPEPGSPDNGMVLDFAELKTLVHQKVIADFDHALVLNGNSPHADIRQWQGTFEKIHWVPFQPTCENLLADILGRLRHHFSAHLQLVALKLRETPSSWAEWKKEDN